MPREDQSQYIESTMQTHRDCVVIAEVQVAKWNRLYPIGTNVWATNRNGEEWKTSTRTSAQVAYEEAYLFVKGDPVAYTLENIRPLRRKKTPDA